MIRLAALFPEHLNLNGDLGNLEVLSKQLNWRGVENVTVPITQASELKDNVDFILVGHGSLAAWADIQDEFLAMVPLLIALGQSGTPGLAISSGFEELVKANLFSPLTSIRANERVSKFEVVKDGEQELLGYVNTDTDLPAIHRSGSWIGSTLHGPVLAKNPALLDEVLAAVATKSAIVLPKIQQSEKAGLVADLVREVWKLEQDLARE